MARAAASVELDDVADDLGAGRSGGHAFVLADARPEPIRSLGPAVRWARSASANRLDLLTVDPVVAGDLARRSAQLGLDGWVTVQLADTAGPAPTVTVAAPDPAVPAPPPPLDPAHIALGGIMTEAGARPVDDHGVLVAELSGLEVARVVNAEDWDGPTGGEPRLPGPMIVVGVGQADRELNRMVHGEHEPAAGLRRVVAAVADYRRPGSHHPLARVSRDRWLRSRLLEQPGLIGAAGLEPVAPLRPRTGLTAPQPVAAVGTTDDGAPLVAVTAVGVDLDLVPEAVDYRARFDPDAELVIVVPPRDLGLATALADLPGRTTVRSIDPPWETRS
ncbi:MAG: hypothetical protein ACK5RL_01340 [Acidimicrobiales bacterium]